MPLHITPVGLSDVSSASYFFFLGGGGSHTAGLLRSVHISLSALPLMPYWSSNIACVAIPVAQQLQTRIEQPLWDQNIHRGVLSAVTFSYDTKLNVRCYGNGLSPSRQDLLSRLF